MSQLGLQDLNEVQISRFGDVYCTYGRIVTGKIYAHLIGNDRHSHPTSINVESLYDHSGQFLFHIVFILNASGCIQNEDNVLLLRASWNHRIPDISRQMSKIQMWHVILLAGTFTFMFVNLKKLGLLRPVEWGNVRYCKTKGKQNYKQRIYFGQTPWNIFEKLWHPLIDILCKAPLTSFTVHSRIAIRALTSIPVQFICAPAVSTWVVKTLVFTWDKATFTDHCKMVF